MDSKFINSRLLGLVGVAAGGDYFYTDRLQEEIHNHSQIVPRSVVKNILREASVPIAEIVRIDLNKIYSEQEPHFFIPYQKIAYSYRERHHVKLKEEVEATDSWAESIPAMIEKNVKERKKYGASLGPYRDGLACYNEQSYFYNTSEWQNRAKVVRVLDNFTCRSCGKNMDSIPDKLHVHHEYPIQSMYSPKFARNFDILRLKTFCKSCHETLHATKIRRTFGFTSATEEEIEKQKEYLKRLKKAHDEAGECNFCFGEEGKGRS